MQSAEFLQGKLVSHAESGRAFLGRILRYVPGAVSWGLNGGLVLSPTIFGDSGAGKFLQARAIFAQSGVVGKGTRLLSVSRSIIEPGRGEEAPESGRSVYFGSIGYNDGFMDGAKGATPPWGL